MTGKDRKKILGTMAHFTLSHRGAETTVVVVTPASLRFRKGATRENLFKEAGRKGLLYLNGELLEAMKSHPTEPKVGNIFRVTISEDHTLKVFRLLRGFKNLQCLNETDGSVFCNPQEKWLFVLPPEDVSQVA